MVRNRNNVLGRSHFSSKRNRAAASIASSLFNLCCLHLAHIHPLARMLTALRMRAPRIISSLHYGILPQRSYGTRDRTSDRVPTNEPNPPQPVQNVSDSNAVPISPQGLRDEELPLQEMPEDSERQRVMQAPNRMDPWSRSQQPRERAMSGPRFEQTIMEYQVCGFFIDVERNSNFEGGEREKTEPES